jgi:YHS domain-containing protein
MTERAKQIAVVLTVLCITAFAGTIRADDLKVRQPNRVEVGIMVKCPVMSSRFEVKEDTPVIDYKGRSYYFCCLHCVDDFSDNPDKYAADGELPLRQPAKNELGKSETCPVSKAEFEVTTWTPVIDYKGKSYYFCCTSCVMEFRKNPDKYSK